ncbi:MAG TPA: hypothetical protein VK875_06835 [Euzebyales bacterium]|nr:hypothetical protein [Euzebyales bacterium]
MSAAGPTARTATVAALVAVLTVLLATPALAHGATPDATNFLSRVTGTVLMHDARPAGAAAAPPGVRWRVLGADALLQVDNTGNADVVVTGYDGEPFLRVGPEGTFENARSPATYLNADRYAQVEVPPAADPDAAPDWRRISDASRWQWHDHRIHWMAPDSPPVDRASGATQTVLEWTVPYRVDERDLGVQGELLLVPPGPVWPWLAGAAAAVLVPVVALLVFTGADPERATRGLVVVIGLVAAGCVAVSVGNALATPASLAADLWAVVQAALPALLAVALAGSLWRRGPEDEASGTGTSLLVAAGVLAVGCGLLRLTELQSSQLVNALPDWAVRATAAGGLTVVLPAALLLVVLRASERQA